MFKFSTYYLVGLVLVLVVLSEVIRYFTYKIRWYIQKNYPEKAKDYKCGKNNWYINPALFWALYKRDDIGDSEFIRLKNKLKLFLKYFGLCYVVGFSLLLVFLIVFYL